MSQQRHQSNSRYMETLVCADVETNLWSYTCILDSSIHVILCRERYSVCSCGAVCLPRLCLVASLLAQTLYVGKGAKL